MGDSIITEDVRKRAIKLRRKAKIIALILDFFVDFDRPTLAKMYSDLLIDFLEKEGIPLEVLNEI